MKRILRSRGAIAWMVRNAVAANLLMLVLVIGGALFAFRIKQEVFPEFDLDVITIGIPYPGASPSEVEQGIVLAVEESIRGIEGIKRVTATAPEGAAGVSIELLVGVDPNRALADIKNAVDRITSLPEDIERPVVSLATNRHDVITVAIYGDQSESVLRELADRAREELLADPNVSYVDLAGVRPREIGIEIPQANLRKHNVTLEQVALQIRRTSVELPGGGVKTKGGEVLLRTAERRDLGREFGDIPLVTGPDGTELRVRDLGRVVDGFADTDVAASFNGKPAVLIQVYRSGDQTPIEVADSVHAFVARQQGNLPPGVSISTMNDRSEMYRDRVDLLMRNARLGLVLVLLVLGLFLEARLAFWVTLGIPISFLGSMLLMPALDVSFNMISLFAFIVCLGIVVDDAIVVGENIYELRERGFGKLEAAIKGTQQIAMPVVFSVLTTVAVFLPLLFVPGFMGKIFSVIALIVVCVLMISLLESIFVLPSHLAHRMTIGRVLGRLWRRLKALYAPSGETDGADEVDAAPRESRLMALFQRPHLAFGRAFLRYTDQVHVPVLRRAVRNRYFTLAVGIAVLAVTLGFVQSGRIEFLFMPKVDSDTVIASLALPFGVPVDETERLQERIRRAAEQVIEHNGGAPIIRGIYTQTGTRFSGRGHAPANQGTGGHLGNIVVFLVPSDQRPGVTAERIAKEWRETVGELAGIESLTFRYSTGPGAGDAIDIELSHQDMDVLEQASAQLVAALQTFDGVRDIDDGFARGKRQLDFKLTPEGRSLGITSADLGRQLRGAFYGAEALRQQRGRDEIRVMVRLPEEERSSEFYVDEMLVRTPEGGEIPLSLAARIERGYSYTMIKRAEGRRVVNVTADIPTDPATGKLVANPDKILHAVRENVMPELQATYRGLGYGFEGNMRERRESMDALKAGYVIALLVVFALLAIPFRSYIQPLVVMTAIPFGIVGAVWGHVIMGYELSLISAMGLIAVSGIVVNDSLVLVHAANEKRREGSDAFEAVIFAGRRRLRPILLTSLTTAMGLAPMIFETSVSARFLIPMAISLGFGVLFATAVLLVIVPSVYMIVEDLRGLLLGARDEQASVAADPSLSS